MPSSPAARSAAIVRYGLPVASEGLYSIVFVRGSVAYSGMRIAALRLAAEKNRLVGAS